MRPPDRRPDWPALAAWGPAGAAAREPWLDALLVLQLAGLLVAGRLAIQLLPLLVLLAAADGRRRPRGSLVRALAFGLPWLILALSGAAHGEPHPLAGKAAQFGAAGLLAWALAGRPDGSTVFFRGVTAGAWLALAVAAWQVGVQGLPRAEGNSNPIPFGNSALLMAAALGLRAAEAGPGRRGPWLAAAAAAAGACWLAGSRGGLLALPAWGLLAGWTWGRGHAASAWRRLGRLALAAGLALGLALLAFMLNPRTQREAPELAQAGTRAHPAEIAARLQMLERGWAALQAAPWTGRPWRDLVDCGGGRPERPAFLEPCPPLEPVHRHLHNDPLSAAAQAGLPGLAAWLLFWALMLHATAQGLRRGDLRLESLLAPGLALGVLAFTLTDSLHGTSNGAVAYGVWLAWALALARGR